MTDTELDTLACGVLTEGLRLRCAEYRQQECHDQAEHIRTIDDVERRALEMVAAMPGFAADRERRDAVSIQTILNEFLAERREQMRQWSLANDDNHTLADWIALLTRHVGLAVNDGAISPCDVERYRRQLIRVGALALAAVEALERKAVHPPEKVAGVMYTGSGW